MERRGGQKEADCEAADDELICVVDVVVAGSVLVTLPSRDKD